MSCARCSQSKTYLRRPLPEAKTLDPLSSDTTVRLVLRLGCGGAQVLRDSKRCLEHDGKRSLHTDYLEGRAVPGAPRPEPGAIT